MSRINVRPKPPVSLQEVNRTVRIPSGSWWRRMLAFAGPAYMVSVGYMDPGNWATDLEGGARFGYQLIWVLLMSNVMAILLQTLTARLGIVTGRDLAQACRQEYPGPIRYILFVLVEIAVIATDLAELLGSAVGLNLLLNIPILYAVMLTGADVLLLLLIQRLGIRRMEAFIVMLISVIGGCFIIELFLGKPDWGKVAGGLVPGVLSSDQLYVAIGILGATVMPHNLYLHSALAQSRNVPRSREAVRQACRYNLIDSIIAMNGAFFINSAILIMAAAVFWSRNIAVTELQQAHQLLSDILGSSIAPYAFAIALIASGQSSTLTGTLAGQITMEGFIEFRIPAATRRILTRLLAIVPAVAVIYAVGDRGIYRLLILSQVILSLQLPFAVVPLVKFTSSKVKMGPFVNPPWVKLAAWAVTLLIIGLNASLAWQQISSWIFAAGSWQWLLGALVVPAAVGLAVLLVWMIFRKSRAEAEIVPTTADEVAKAVAHGGRSIARIGVALEAKNSDSAMLSEAVALARTYHAELVLIHVVEGVGGQWYGAQTGDMESRHDELYLHDLTERLADQLKPSNIKVRPLIGFGNVPQQLILMVEQEKLDMLVVGGHGHKGLSDVLRGQTIEGVRHALTIPILAVRPEKKT